MNPCNYAWNFTSLGFGRSTDMDISRYKEDHEDSLEIFGNVEQFYGCSQLAFNIPKFARELTIKLAGFYTIPNLHAIAEIESITSYGRFMLWLLFKEE
jgi:hypothetical protein